VMPLSATPSLDQFRALGAHRRLAYDVDLALANALGVQYIVSGTGSETAETERMTMSFYFPIVFRNARLLGYYVYCRTAECYVDTVVTTYYYKAYVQPVKLDLATGAETLLDVERTLFTHSRAEAPAAAWVEDVVDGELTVTGLDISLAGVLLGLRVRTTSWALAAATTGHGLYGLRDPYYWITIFDLEAG